jgi:hypothetical protein
MRVDIGEVEFAGEKEDDGADGGEGSITVGSHVIIFPTRKAQTCAGMITEYSSPGTMASYVSEYDHMIPNMCVWSFIPRDALP